LREIEQGELPTPGAQELLLISGRVTYDDGNLFRLTPQMSNYAFGRNAGINAADAAKLGLSNGDSIIVQNERAEITLSARIHEQVLPGTIWIPESIEGAPAGALSSGDAVTKVTVKVAERAMPVAA
jgi:anaerobic selenocysteine-containing dehydrogenase